MSGGRSKVPSNRLKQNHLPWGRGSLPKSVTRVSLYLKHKFLYGRDFCPEELAQGLRAAHMTALPGTRQMSHPWHLVMGTVSLQERRHIATATDHSFREKQGQKM